MAATDLVRASTRVAMVWPHRAMIQRDVVDLHHEPSEESELVDQAHFGESVRILGEHLGWRYVQGEDMYFGWLPERFAPSMSVYSKDWRVVAVVLADVHERPDRGAPVIGRVPAGAHIPQVRAQIREGDSVRDLPAPDLGAWRSLVLRLDDSQSAREGFISLEDLVAVADLPRRYPTSVDLLNTAEAFLGVPYLWGGTTALGMDCSGFVQQVYRLNGLALPRDADQQAMLGRRVDEARAGDLLFFGAESVTHVALATSSTEFVHAPMTGGVVERGRLGGDRKLRGVRRYLPDVLTP